MADLIHLLTFESHKLMMAASQRLKHRLKEKVQKVLRQPVVTPAAVMKATKLALQEIDILVKSDPDAKNAKIAVTILYFVLLRIEAREMVRLVHQGHGSQELDSLMSHLNNSVGFASMVQPLLKEADADQLEVLEAALRRIH